LIHVEGGKVKKIGNETIGAGQSGVDVIEDLEELRKIWPEVFKP
jgi:hypothetical protein